MVKATIPLHIGSTVNATNIAKSDFNRGNFQLQKVDPNNALPLDSKLQ